MAFLFLFLTLAIAAIYFGMRKTSIALWAVAILLGIGVFWHHVTSILQINW